MLNEVLKRRIIPVIVIDDADKAVPLAEALLEGGIDVIEITFRTKAASESIRRIQKVFPEMLIGAGTVVTLQQAKQAIDAGAGFSLAPGLNPEIVRYVQSRKSLFIPGVMTPSEIEKGIALGCQLLKFYPVAAAGGASMLTAVATPYASQQVKFCPTGGITLDNMSEYLALPMVAMIGGSWLATQKQIAESDWVTITRQASEALEKVTERGL